VSIIIVSNRGLSMRVMRGLAVALVFLCIGSLIQTALIFGYLVVSGEVIRDAPSFAWRLLALITLAAGPTGLIAGVWETLFGRISARATFVISAIVAFAHLILWIAVLLISRPPLPGGNNMQAVLTLLWLLAVLLLSFLAAVMACWKMIDIVRGKTPTLDVAQLFEGPPHA
jgi:hypothetical protein